MQDRLRRVAGLVAVAALILAIWPPPARAYIDAGGWQVTLPEILSEFRTVTLVEAEKVNLARGGFKFRLGKPLKGVPDLQDLRLQIEWGEAGPPFKEVKPGRVALHFTQSSDRKAVPSSASPAFENLIAQRACLTFLDGTWFHTMPGADGWQAGTVRRDFEIAFTGTSVELADAISGLLRGREVLVCCRRMRNTAELQWVRYSLREPNAKTLARDPSAPPAAGRPWTAWAADLKDASGPVRSQAALSLAELGAEARGAEAALTQALRDPDPDVRAAAVAALGALVPEGRAAVDGLARALSDDDWFVRLGAARALQNFGPRAAPAVPALVQATKPNDLIKDFRPVRCGAAMVALARADPGSKELAAACRMLVAKLLEDERQGSFGARATGARLLGDCGVAALPAVPALLRLLKDPDADVRVAVAEALLKVDPEGQGSPALGVLTESLRHPDLLVRLRAVEALGARGARAAAALPALREAARDPEPELRRAAEEAVRKVEGPER
jgi:HEAT repeat protein